MRDYYKIERVIVGEVGRRRCPSCRCPLSGSLVATVCNDRTVGVTFTCAWCKYTGGGSIHITPDLLLEAETRYGQMARSEAGEISPDEMISLHEELQSEGWFQKVVAR